MFNLKNILPVFLFKKWVGGSSMDKVLPMVVWGLGLYPKNPHKMSHSSNMWLYLEWCYGRWSTERRESLEDTGPGINSWELWLLSQIRSKATAKPKFVLWYLSTCHDKVNCPHKWIWRYIDPPQNMRLNKMRNYPRKHLSNSSSLSLFFYSILENIIIGCA